MSEQFGILSPAAGFRSDFPNILLPSAYVDHKDTQNIAFRWGEIHRASMRSQTFTPPAGSPSGVDLSTGATQAQILKYHFFTTDAGVDHLFAFIRDDIYTWSSVNGWTVHNQVTAALSNTDYWSVVTYQNNVYATNGIDPILVSNGSTAFDTAENADDLDKGLQINSTPDYVRSCKKLIAFENYLMCLHTKEGADGTGTWVPNRIRWGDILSIDFDGGDAGNLDLEGDDNIITGGLWRDFLIVFKERSYHRLYLALPNPLVDLVFGSAVVSRQIGCPAIDGVIEGKSNDLYFFGSDMTIREIQFGENSQPIDPELKLNVPTDLAPLVSVGLDDLRSEMWFSVPDLTTTPSARTMGATTSTPTNVLDDATFGGVYEGSEREIEYKVKIKVVTSSPDTFDWFKDGGTTEGVLNCTTTPQALDNGITVLFADVDGHAVDDQWVMTVKASNSKTWIYHPEFKRWSPRSFGVVAYGEAKIEQLAAEITWDTWNKILGVTNDKWDLIWWQTWDGAETSPGFISRLISDNTGKTFFINSGELDDGSAATGIFVLTTTMSDSGSNNRLALNKRLLAIRPLFRNETDAAKIVTVSVATDNNNVFVPLADGDGTALTVSLNGSGDIFETYLPCDFLAKAFHIKFEGANPYRFVGVIFDFVTQGPRQVR